MGFPGVLATEFLLIKIAPSKSILIDDSSSGKFYPIMANYNISSDNLKERL